MCICIPQLNEIWLKLTATDGMQTSLILNVSENAYGSIVCLNDLVFVLETRYNFLTLINFINLLLNILFKLLHIMIMHTVSE